MSVASSPPRTFHAEALDHIEDGVLATDRDGRITYANAPVLDVLGVTRESLVGRRVWEALATLDDTGFRHQYDLACREQRAVAFEAYAEPYGLWLRVRIVPISDGMAAYLSDPTACP